jgi:hypothetical protein
MSNFRQFVKINPGNAKCTLSKIRKMRSAAKTPFLCVLLFIYLTVNANDGTFRANGNQLIPMYETDVSVQKEVLTIRRINARQAQVVVYYEFFNPKEAKELEVGFEAYSPSGDVDMTPGASQPYITKFTVDLNGGMVPYKVIKVRDSLYYRNGKYKSMSVAAVKKELSESDYPDFFYVYHFRAFFKHGLNMIRHSYIVDLSNSVFEFYSLDYVLTAAKRWANRQIDDFTLQIDMGEFQDVCVDNDFFGNVSEWKTDNAAKSLQTNARGGEGGNSDTCEFFIREGMIVFTKKNFKPAGELHLRSFNNYYFSDRKEDDGDTDKPAVFDWKKTHLPFSIDDQDGIPPPADEFSRKVLRNLPFARRGYVFKSPELQDYFKRQKWYWPDPAYIPVAALLTRKEQEWLKK